MSTAKTAEGWSDYAIPALGAAAGGLLGGPGGALAGGAAGYGLTQMGGKTPAAPAAPAAPKAAPIKPMNTVGDSGTGGKATSVGEAGGKIPALASLVGLGSKGEKAAAVSSRELLGLVQKGIKPADQGLQRSMRTLGSFARKMPQKSTIPEMLLEAEGNPRGWWPLSIMPKGAPVFEPYEMDPEVLSILKAVKGEKTAMNPFLGAAIGGVGGYAAGKLMGNRDPQQLALLGALGGGGWAHHVGGAAGAEVKALTGAERAAAEAESVAALQAGSPAKQQALRAPAVMADMNAKTRALRNQPMSPELAELWNTPTGAELVGSRLGQTGSNVINASEAVGGAGDAAAATQGKTVFEAATQRPPPATGAAKTNPRTVWANELRQAEDVASAAAQAAEREQALNNVAGRLAKKPIPASAPPVAATKPAQSSGFGSKRNRSSFGNPGTNSRGSFGDPGGNSDDSPRDSFNDRFSDKVGTMKLALDMSHPVLGPALRNRLRAQ